MYPGLRPRHTLRPCPLAQRPGSSSANGPSPTRCASTCSRSRPRCARTPGGSAATRRAGGSRASCTTWTTSAIPDLETGHPRMAIEELRRRDYPEEVVHAVQAHAELLGVPRESLLDKALFACDELSGFIAACAYVRPEGIHGLKTKSVKKKLKQPSFAAGVHREDVYEGAAELEPESGMRLRRARAVRDRRARRARRRAGPRARRRTVVAGPGRAHAPGCAAGIRRICEHVFVRWQQPGSRQGERAFAPAIGSGRRCAARSTPPRRSTSAFTRYARNRR